MSKLLRFFVILLLWYLAGTPLLSQVSGGASNSSSFQYDSSLYKVKKLTFFAPSSDSSAWIKIRNDIDTTFLSGDTSSLAWRNDTIMTPIGYVSGVKGEVEACFNIQCVGEQDYYVWARNEEGYNLPIKKLETLQGEYVYPREPLLKLFPAGVVGFWDTFDLKWYISNSNSIPSDTSEWVEIGCTKNQLYVTKDEPKVESPILEQVGLFPTLAHHTTLHLSCKNAKNLSGDQEIVDAIYSEFQDQIVFKLNGTQAMEYWGDGIDTVFSYPQCRKVRGLLEFENTTCGTWSNFFRDMIRLQGDGSIESYYVDWYEALGSTPNGQTLVQQYFNDLSAFFQGAPEATGHPVIYPQGSSNYIPTTFAVEKWADDTSSINLTYVMSERDDIHSVLDSPQPTKNLSNGNIIPYLALPGLAGQGNSDPVSEFINHAINEYDGQYYDPSYGTLKKDSQNAWEKASIDFFGAKATCMITENNGMMKEYYLTWFAEQNTPLLQMRFISIP